MDKVTSLVTLLSLVAVGVVLACTEGDKQGEGCRAYSECINGQWVGVDCPYPEEVFDMASEECTPVAAAAPPCGDNMDCATLPDGMYPHMETDCAFFFTCTDGMDMGLQECNPGTVFDYNMQLCNYPEAVAPPCGTNTTTVAK